jgi:protein-tyrosine sulfotransferase
MALLDKAWMRDIIKFVSYALDARSFQPHFDTGSITPQAMAAAETIRGTRHAPVLIIHGIMPRAGTVYVGELLRLHPDLYAYPHHVWELPFLQHSPRIEALNREFLWSYEQNMGKIGDRDFLPLFGASLIAYLHQATPPGQRMLLKVPSVQHLSQFYTAFPHEHLLLLVRDGRDVVQSTLKTWPQLRFSMVCLRWRRAARMVLWCDRHFRDRDGYWLARFEDAVREPEVFVQESARRFQLDEARFPYQRIASIPVHGSSATRVDGKVTWSPVARSRGFRPVGRWQSWSPWRKWLFKQIAGEELIQLGYATDMNW